MGNEKEERSKFYGQLTIEIDQKKKNCPQVTKMKLGNFLFSSAGSAVGLMLLSVKYEFKISGNPTHQI